MDKTYYIIELGGEKEVWEMESLELKNMDDALHWIKDSMKDDSEYFNVNIECDIYPIEFEEYEDSKTDYKALNKVIDFKGKALVYIKSEDIVTDEMKASDIYDVDTIIESNLSIVSKIITRMTER